MTSSVSAKLKNPYPGLASFEEQDAPVIEAQQEIIDAALTPVDPVILAIDVGPVRYKQILQRLIRNDQPVDA